MNFQKQRSKTETYFAHQTIKSETITIPMEPCFDLTVAVSPLNGGEFSIWKTYANPENPDVSCWFPVLSGETGKKVIEIHSIASGVKIEAKGRISIWAFKKMQQGGH